MEVFGAPADVIDQTRREQEAEDVFYVYADNVDTVWAFFALATQWRILAGFGAVVYQGFDYGAIPSALSLLGIPAKRRAEVFEGLRVMESAALLVLNAKDDDG